MVQLVPQMSVDSATPLVVIVGGSRRDVQPARHRRQDAVRPGLPSALAPFQPTVASTAASDMPIESAGCTTLLPAPVRPKNTMLKVDSTSRWYRR